MKMPKINRWAALAGVGIGASACAPAYHTGPGGGGPPLVMYSPPAAPLLTYRPHSDTPHTDHQARVATAAFQRMRLAQIKMLYAGDCRRMIGWQFQSCVDQVQDAAHAASHIAASFGTTCLEIQRVNQLHGYSNPDALAAAQSCVINLRTLRQDAAAIGDRAEFTAPFNPRDYGTGYPPYSGYNYFPRY